MSISILSSCAFRKMVLLFIVLMVCQAALPTVDSNGDFDISDIIFASDYIQTMDNGCTTDFLRNVTSSEITSSSANIRWNRIQNATSLIGYQILYWEITTTSYYNITVGLVSNAVLVNLTSFTSYYVSVRGVCQEERYGVASDRIDISTRSAAPSQAPVITENVTHYLNQIARALLIWLPIPDDVWNGDRLNYIVVVADVTPDFSRQFEYEVDYDVTSLEVTELQLDHTYLAAVYAQSSGGLGPSSNLVIFTVEEPLEPNSSSENPGYVSYFYFLIIPCALVVALCITTIIICVKRQSEKKKRSVSFVTDISTNIEQGRIRTSHFNNTSRLEAVRTSQRNRPLPAHPVEHTPSVSSMHAHLIDQSSPPHQNFEMEHFHLHRQMHYPENLPMLDTEPHNFRSTSITSPPFPQLSQPLSDLSSATPSSVFVESVIPHQDNRNLLSPSNPNPYEVPNESETGHVSVSPTGNIHNFPHFQRSHTSTVVSQPFTHSAPMHPPAPVTQSSSELFHGSIPPDVPPHRTSNTLGRIHSPISPVEVARKGHSVSPKLVRPESGLYSEIPGETSPERKERKFISAVNPSFGPSVPYHSEGNNSSIVSSDQYSDYSDIPSACGPQIDNKIHEHRGRLPPDGLNNRTSSLSDSISSFSTDSQSGSPHHGRHLNGEHTNSHVDGTRKSLEHHSPELPTPTPYLSPTSIISSNGHAPSLDSKHDSS